ncbi:MAG: hypothetical protein RJQ08_00010 [Salinisphaeraceae bacterium]
MRKMFGNRGEATLKKSELSFLGDLVHNIPQLVLEHKTAEETREELYDKEQERINSEEKLSKEVETMAPEDIPAQVYRSFKAIEICGQIIRNRYGSLNKVALHSLVGSTYGVGTRFMDFFIEALQDAQTEIVELIERIVSDDPRVSHERLEREARSVLLWTTFGTIYGAIKRIGYCVGARECLDVYEAQTRERDTPAAKLVEAYIRLFYARDMDAKWYEELHIELEGNPICQRVLKCLVLEFIYLNNVHYRKRQELSQAVDVNPNKSRALTRS